MYWLAWENSWRFATPPRFQPVRSTFQIWVVTRHQTVWNFCACASDVTWWGNQLWRREMTAVFSGYVSVRLRVVPHFSSGIVERVKRERAWKSPHARRARRVLPFLAWGDFHARSRLAPSTIPEEKWGTTGSLCIGQPSDLYRSSEATEVWFSNLILPSRLAVPAQSSFTGGFCEPGTGIYFVPRFVVQPIFNRSFLSSKNSHFESEWENEFYLHDSKNHFHNNGFARSLALKQRLGGTRKRPNHADALVLLVKVMLQLFITFVCSLPFLCCLIQTFFVLFTRLQLSGSRIWWCER